MDIELPITIKRQPDYTTCGPTSLHAVYSFYQDPILLPQVISEVHKHEGGGTLSIHLAVHALRRGYAADVWIFSVRHFDPTWFRTKTDYIAKMKERLRGRGLEDDPRYGAALKGLEEFFALGGRVHWRDLTPGLIGRILRRGHPILTGTNGTYLYQCARETAEGPDDVHGEPFGHFVCLCGYHSGEHTVSIADPLMDNPLHGSKYYRASVHRLIGAIFLGAATDDSNFMVIRPKHGGRSDSGGAASGSTPQQS